jgi:hypothetical protein
VSERSDVALLRIVEERRSAWRCDVSVMWAFGSSPLYIFTTSSAENSTRSLGLETYLESIHHLPEPFTQCNNLLINPLVPSFFPCSEVGFFRLTGMFLEELVEGIVECGAGCGHVEAEDDVEGEASGLRMKRVVDDVIEEEARERREARTPITCTCRPDPKPNVSLPGR